MFVSAMYKKRQPIYAPPELFYTIECDHPLDILHPALRRDPTRGVRQRGLRERRHRCLWEIAALGGWGVKPESPGREKRMLEQCQIIH